MLVGYLTIVQPLITNSLKIHFVDIVLTAIFSCEKKAVGKKLLQTNRDWFTKH